MSRFVFSKKAFLLLGCILLAGMGVAVASFATAPSFSHEEQGFEADDGPEPMIGRYSVAELEAWTRPAGPPKVGIQAGHWKNDEVPQEQEGLKKNGGGAVGGGMNEREVVLVIAQRLVEQLTAQGIQAELLPATVPPGYVADAFVSIHADGSLDTSVSGYKVAPPRRDYSGAAVALSNSIETAYGTAMGLRKDDNITSRMRGYYAFNWRRYEHAIHPKTPAAIVETGFLTNAADRRLLSREPDTVAAAIATGIVDFLKSQRLLPVGGPTPPQS